VSKLGDATRLGSVRGVLLPVSIVAGTFAFVALATYYDAGIGVLGLLFLLVFPAQTVFALLLGIEEEVVAGGHSSEAVSPLVRVGSEFFSASALGLRLPLLVVLVGTVCVLFRYRRSMPLTPLLLLSALVLWSASLATSQGYDFKGAIGAATPWILVLCGYVFGSFVSSTDRLRTQIVWIAAGLIFVKAVVGVVVFVRGEAIPDPTGLASVVYYDSTLSYVAMTFLVAWMYSTARQRPATILMASSAIVILVAMRRNVVAATGWALVAVTLLKGKWKQTARLAAGLIAIVGAASILLPGPLANIAAGFERSFSTLLTGEGDSSTTGHVNDIEVGINVIMQSPIWGLGVYPEPQAGLVVGNSGNLYIHNELLQTWARFGLGGVIILVLLLGLGIFYAIRVVVKNPSDLLGAASAVFFLACPIPLMFFPHLSTLVRFAFFTGLFLAILSHEARVGDHFANSRRSQLVETSGAEVTARRRLGSRSPSRT
jgi:hypothetical protein